MTRTNPHHPLSLKAHSSEKATTTFSTSPPSRHPQAPTADRLGCQPSLLLFRLVLAGVRVLDGQAPDIQIVTDADDDVDDEARVHAEREPQTREHEGDLVDAVAERAGPADTEAGLQHRPQGVEHAVDERQDEDVLVREGGFGEVLFGRISKLCLSHDRSRS